MPLDIPKTSEIRFCAVIRSVVVVLDSINLDHQGRRRNRTAGSATLSRYTVFPNLNTTTSWLDEAAAAAASETYPIDF
jgi:hypothetical protein